MSQSTKVIALLVLAVLFGGGMAFGILMLQENLSVDTTTTTTTAAVTTTTTTSGPIEIPDPLSYEGVDIWWLVVGGIKIKSGDTVIYIDPFEIADLDTSFLEPADFIVITHDHAPHCSPADISVLSDSNTTLICSERAAYRLVEDYSVLPNDTLTFNSITFEFVPSYNVDKYRENGQLFHQPEDDYVGVIIDFDGTRVYHAGDTDRIPEMKSISTDIALLPVSGYAWMEPDEAAGAVDDLQLSSDLAYAVPIHWGHNQGTRWHAERFAELANCTVIILDRLVQ